MSAGRALQAWAAGARLGVRLLASASLALAAAAQGSTPGREGSLQNDSFVATNREAAELLARGDAELARRAGAAASVGALELEGDAGRRAAAAACERWYEALQAAQPGEAVPLALGELVADPVLRWRDPDATFGRRAEAIEVALLRRLTQAPPSLAEVWRERVAQAGGEMLSLMGASRPGLVRVEHLHPATPAGARAALRLFDLGVEAGRPRAAASWLERAEVHAALAGAAELEQAALRRRRRISLFLAARAATEPARDETWRRAERLAEAGWQLLATRGRTAVRPPVPGLVLLPEGRRAIQVDGVVWIYDDEGPSRGFEPAQVARGRDLEPPEQVAGRDPAWALVPVTDGELLFLVEGRAGRRLSTLRVPFEERGELWQGNMLAAILPPRALELPELRWALGPRDWLDPEGARRPLAEVLGPGLWEFQPGPAVAGSLLLVQARNWGLEGDERPEPVSPAEARVHVLALDRRSGQVVWNRFLGRGADLRPDLGLPVAQRELVREPAQPLLVAGGRVFAGTGLGMGCLLDLADGRLVWSFLNRRRNPRAEGWRGHRAPPLDPGSPPVALWAPSDSDHLYRLRLGPDLAGEGLSVHPPHPQGEGEELVGGDAERLLILGRSGGRRTLTAHEAGSGRRLDSIYFGRAERPVSGALASDARAFVATDRGIYLFDLERELYLLQHLPLELQTNLPPGGLFAGGDSVWLVADRRLWRYRVEPPGSDGR